MENLNKKTKHLTVSYPLDLDVDILDGWGWEDDIIFVSNEHGSYVNVVVNGRVTMPFAKEQIEEKLKGEE